MTERTSEPAARRATEPAAGQTTETAAGQFTEATAEQPGVSPDGDDDRTGAETPAGAGCDDTETERHLEEALEQVVHGAVVGVTAMAVPVVVYRRSTTALFGEGFGPDAPLLPVFAVATVAAAGSVGFLVPTIDLRVPRR